MHFQHALEKRFQANREYLSLQQEGRPVEDRVEPAQKCVRDRLHLYVFRFHDVCSISFVRSRYP